MTDAMEAEFDLVAEWTRQAVRQLGDESAPVSTQRENRARQNARSEIR